MDEIDKKPEIRFTGFADAWARRDVSQLVDVRSGRDYKHLSKGNIPVYGTGGYMLSVNEALSYNEDAIGIGRKGTIDKPYILKAPFWTVDTLFYAVPKGDNSIDFVYGIFQKTDWKKKDESTGVPSLSKAVINDTQVFVPKCTEQKIIGNFFKSIDNLITLHQRKNNKLVVIKKSMLEKMFPKDGSYVPEIRFSGFADDWKQWKVGDVLTEKPRPIKMEDDEEYQLVTVKRRNEGIVSRGYFKGKDILVKNYFEIRSGDYLISKRQVVHGANGIVPEHLDKSIVSNEYLVAIGNENITTEYWTLISKRPNMYRQFFLSSYGVDIEKLVFDVDDWKKRTIILPSLPEQARITLFFKQLDHLIILHQRELEKLKNIKKSLLEKMFV